MEKVAIEETLQKTIDQFWESVPYTWNLIRSNLRATAAEKFDISVEQFHILRHIRRGFTSVSELAEARQISRPAISQLVDGLVDKELVTRRQEADDRRFVHLALTPAGEELLNEVFHSNRAWMAERMASLSQEDLEKITEGMALLRGAFVEE